MKQKVILIVSLVIGVLAFLLTQQYLKSETGKIRKLEEEFRRSMEMVQIVMANKELPGNSVLSKTDLGGIMMPKRSLNDRHILSEDYTRLIGKKILFAMRENQPILWSDIEGGTPSDQGLAPIIREKMRAISLNISGAAGVSGMIQPNNRIDVLGTFNFPSKKNPNETESVTLTILQNVTVLATGQTLAKDSPSMGQKKNANAGYSTVTLEVTPREAELLVFAQQMRGSLTTALRNPSDLTFEKELPSVDFELLEKKLPELNQYRQENIIRKSK